MNLTDIIMSLADAPGVAGDEAQASELALSYLKKYTDDCCIKNGNVIGNFGIREHGRPHILIDAHIDQIGFVVTYITDDGFLKISNCGGIDTRILLAQQVTVHGAKPVSGVICSIPPHLESGEDEEKVPKISDICIDVGMTKENAEKIISLGDRVTYAVKSKKLLGDKITAMALDDRCGVAALLYAAELLQDKKPACSYSIMFSTQEEIGERGAKIGAYDINSDISIEVDVSFALTADDSEVKCGHLGKGCMIGFAPSLDRELSEKMVQLAKDKNIPYQLEIMNGATGTNADRFSVNRSGSKAVTLSIPLKYMHTPVEVISEADVVSTAKLIAAYIEEVKA